MYIYDNDNGGSGDDVSNVKNGCMVYKHYVTLYVATILLLN